MFFLASEPLTDKIVWQNGNRYTFRLRSSTYMQTAMLVPEAAKANKKRWAIVYPNYEYGQSAAATFKEQLKKLQPDVEFVGEQAPPLGKVDAGAVVAGACELEAGRRSSTSCSAPTLPSSSARAIPVASSRTASCWACSPASRSTWIRCKDESPEGWIVTGYPWYGIDLPDHKAFLDAYRKKYNDYPRLGSIVGYSMVTALAAGLKKAGSDRHREADQGASRGSSSPSPFGKASFRAIDHQSTMGVFVGKTAIKDGKGVMVDYRYEDGAKFQPTETRRVRSRLRDPTRRRRRVSGLLFQLLNGLASASSLFLVAAGLSLIFGVTRDRQLRPRLVLHAGRVLRVHDRHLAADGPLADCACAGFWLGDPAGRAGRRR